MQFDPAFLIDAIQKLGIIGVLTGLVILFIRGTLRSGPQVDGERMDMKEERDAWKSLAQSAAPELKRLNDLLETAVRLLLDPERNARDAERIRSIIEETVDDAVKRVLNDRQRR